jgi:hypothetical protein
MFYVTGYNKYMSNISKITIHAEVDALIKFAKKFNKIQSQISNKTFSLCVFRTNKKGDKLLCSMCCDSCLKSIKDFNEKNKFKIANIYYIDWDSNIRIYTV